MVADGKAEVVIFDYSQQQKADIPEEFRRAMAIADQEARSHLEVAATAGGGSKL